jgi:two-component system, chemotaxis family, CheB/CheR fusion protein
MAQDGARIERNRVYLLPGGATLSVPGGHVCVPKNGGSIEYPGDVLFTSLAQLRGARAVGVVLSGSGSDGACGVQAIKRCGGVTFAQHPGSARVPSMPISAIETGCVDFVLSPCEMARELARVVGSFADPARAATAATYQFASVAQAASAPLKLEYTPK